MKASALTLAALLCMVGPSKIAEAQCFTFSTDLGAYTDESTDGTNIYASAEIDGATDMVISPSCAPYLPTFVHTPEVYNQLSISGGGSVGGWGSGSQVCETCYLSYKNEQSIAPTRGQTVAFNWDAEAVCSGGGEFWGSTGNLNIGIGIATYFIEHLNEGGGATYTLTWSARQILYQVE